ncbi:carbamoyl-phosphate synthase large subunit [Candidatus Viadribacter manganicus]|uniref:Carbamoyl phosphate synthase large chain n=1 Tax=Candidatus Viadribacter manganicus TaxID=1759059 RepID=A0A1B1AKE5_9PROT|nr:carbamoyl-phosphate synthase large subunit [Candidatus Viadribacter manganicus]ANP47015.1 carbamoyl phosphate synthase large subunit [Candidatus Viadribacter manganicus]
MPKRTDINSILIIGAGPIIIGQACEFDYSGVQAVKVLKAEGYRVILVNSNPATIMTDPGLAHATYIEPITPEMVEKIIEKEKPDALLPTMGGQTALNCALTLERTGVLKKHGVEMIGANAEVIEKAEHRMKFRDAMDKIGLESPRSRLCNTMDQALEALEHVQLPSIIRPSLTLGGLGGGVAYNLEEFKEIVERGLTASPITEILVEESIIGWKEYEMEVVRDKADNCIIICSIENIDPMGVHTGDSITVAPALTLTDREYQIMRNASIAVLREIGVETGGSNVQFAVNPRDGRMVVIEMNPRVSRSSALASKATGFPIAKVAAKCAIGYTLDEIANDITDGAMPASFEPTIDYVVTKIPRFAFERFQGCDTTLTTSMKSVGEAMAIGRTFQESLQKALRSLDTGLSGLDEIQIEGASDEDNGRAAVRARLVTPKADRLLACAEALRRGLSVEEICAASHFDPWFVRQIAEIITKEAEIRADGLPKDAATFRALKAQGFSDARLAKLTGQRERDVRAARRKLGVRPQFKRIDSCAAEFRASTPYMYSTYEFPAYGSDVADCESDPSDRNKVIILGGGPNRIGQGIEFDYCCCHAAFACAEIGVESIMVNCNPETVSTDYDTSDRLYFEPLTTEDVLEIVETEKSRGTVQGLIVQFGGQTPLKLAQPLADEGAPILGTSVDAIDLAEDRDRFQALLRKIGLKQPDNTIAPSLEAARAGAARIGYPVMLRPSYVLGGLAMQIVHNEGELEEYVTRITRALGGPSELAVSEKKPLLVDRYLRDAIEVDVDAICDGEDVFVAGVMEHIEEAGVHSGDSACALPPYSLSKKLIDEIETQTKMLALALDVRGLINIQFAVKDDEIFILEANPRASRTAPFVAKAINRPIAAAAAKVMAGVKLKDLKLDRPSKKHVAVKEAVFPFARFPGVDPVLGPEMRSTGEVMGLDESFVAAFAKSQIASGINLPVEGCCFISVKNADKPALVPVAKDLIALGFKVMATGGTADYLIEKGIEVHKVNKVAEGRPHIVDAMKNGEVQLVFNTTEGAQSYRDSYSIRRTALVQNIPYYTTVSGARAAIQAIRLLKSGAPLGVRALQAYA